MSVQREIYAELTNNARAGYWRVIAYPPGEPARDVTVLRGLPVIIGDYSFADPFGAQEMNLTLPQVTIFDKFGVGELDWLAKEVDVDVVWTGALPLDYPQGRKDSAGVFYPQWRWEGYIINFDRESGSPTSVQLKGAGLQLDNFIAKPEYPAQPLPYEWAMSRQFLNRHSLRLAPLRVEWPTWWDKTYAAPKPGTPPYMVPVGVQEGHNWTGLLTRSTGTWDPVLTSYINSLLAAMYSERGRWTMDFVQGRQPVLFHRDFQTAPGPSTVEIDPVAPGVKIALKEDWEQALTTVYGQGTSLSGVAYSGMQVSSNGANTIYRPMAALRQVYPAKVDNGWLDPNVMEREVLVQMQTGLSQDDAVIVARAHLSRFSNPGYTGTITLSSDPKINGVIIGRHLVKAGMSVHVPYVLGRPEGVMAHIASSNHSIASGITTLTIDTKYRDALTVNEVMLRGRDSLSINRMLIAGQYKPPVDDQMFPWSYTEGSGFIPSNSSFSCVKMMADMPDDIYFPWTEWTKAHPPSSSRWRSSYLRLGPTQPNADLNWILQNNSTASESGVPIRMAQAGNIRLLQVAAYDINGNVLKVPFHVSFYYQGGVNQKSTPMIPAEQVSLFPPYQAGQHYPFVRDGWETFNIDGTMTNPKIPHPTESVGLIKAYGTFYEKAGFFPGAYSEGDVATGMLVDETTWSFDTKGSGAALWNEYNIEANLVNPKAGQIYAMFYCDAQVAQEVFFLGRLYRTEPTGA